MKESSNGIRHFAHMMAWTWRFVKPWRGRFLLGVLVALFQPIWITVTMANMLKDAVQYALDKNMSSMYGTLAYMGVSLAVCSVIFPIAYYLIYSSYTRGLGHMRRQVFDHIQGLPVSYVEGHLSGETLTRMTTDLGDASQLFGYPAVGQFNIFSMVLSLVVLVVMMLVENAPVAAPALLLSALSIGVVLYFAPKLRAAEERRKESVTSLTQGMIDTMGGNAVARVFGLVDRQKATFEKTTGDVYGHAMRGVRVGTLSGVLSDGYNWLLLIVLAVFGFIYYINTGNITLPSIIYLGNLLINICFRLTNIGRRYNELQRYVVAADRLKALLEEPQEQERNGGVTPDFDAEHAVEVSGLTFGYAEDKPILDAFTLGVKRGERLAIVGSSGGGKTTLFKILLDFVEHDRTRVILYGNEQHRYSLTDMRGLMAYVPQDCYLFDGTIRENVQWGNPSASAEQVENAVRDAGLYDFIMTLPEQFDTQVGERGAQLSGGERQRIAIARAILRDAPLLLLDEATSSLDAQNEHAVQGALERLMKGRTSIVVAHRLQTIQSADRILVLEGGHIQEEGKHDELMARGGRYAQLFAMQFS